MQRGEDSLQDLSNYKCLLFLISATYCLLLFFQLPKKKKPIICTEKKIGSAPTRGGTGLTQEALAKIIISKKRCQLKYFQESWFHYWPTFYPLIKQERGEKTTGSKGEWKNFGSLENIPVSDRKKDLGYFFILLHPSQVKRIIDFWSCFPTPSLRKSSVLYPGVRV